MVTSASYDQDYRLSGLALANGAANISSLSYAYADGMHLTAITDNVTPASTAALWYTAGEKLQNADGPWGQSTFYYDAVGNRTYDINTIAAVTTTKVQGYATTSNRLANVSVNGTTSRTFLHDGAGNITSDQRPGETFVTTYNKRNRPVSITRNAVAYASYGYNALEQLTSRQTSAAGGPTGTVHYIYDLDGHVIAEADAATGVTSRDYLWLASNDDDPLDLPLAVAEGANIYHVHADHLGRPIRMTDAAKATVWQAAWKPWGEPQAISGTKALNLRFPGQVFQIETGYHHNWHRHYDPTTGRYTQPDPLGFVDGPSVYAYATNSPFMRTDREGLAIGDFPPPPPGYDPKTWTRGMWVESGRWYLTDPKGNIYTIHPEDSGHWRHWDKEGRDGDDNGRWPPNSKKPWPNQKKKLSPQQCETDPSGNQEPWQPYFSPMEQFLFSPGIPLVDPIPGGIPGMSPIPQPIPVPIP
jgi:RHS repeat-associated protein